MQPCRWALHLVLCSAVAVVMATPAQLLAQQSSEQPVVNNAATAKFANFPGLPECFTGTVENGDPNKGPSVILLKGTAGCAVPWHWHTPNEQVMMVSGNARIQAKDEKPALLQPGSYVFMPSHHVHRFSCSGACTAFLHSDGIFDLHYVNGAGQEISPEEALKAANKGTTTSIQQH